MKSQVLLIKLVFMKLKKMPKLADRLKFVRAYKNMSQAEIADIAGTTQQAIQQAETGKARQPRYLHKLAMELDIPIEWMVFGNVAEITQSSKSKKGMEDQSSEILNDFFSMSERDQELMAELMKSRKEK